MTDREQTGKPDDFAQFVHATGTRLYRTAYLLCGEHHLAEDLTQQTFAQAFVHWRRVSRSDNPAAYARTMLTNAFLSHKRLRRNAERPTPDERMPDGDDTAFVGGSDWAERRDLIAALAELSPTDRAILVARYFDDRSVADVARDFGLSENALRTRCHRAAHRLRPLLASTSEGSHRP